MTENCPECGAAIPVGGSCRDHFHALLLLEGEIPGVLGSIMHFYVVSTYGLQHPNSMNYTPEAAEGLRSMLADALDGRAAASDIRRRGRRATEGTVRVTRRAGEPEVRWYKGPWPMTIADVCTADTFGSYDTYDEFADHVKRWARSVRETLQANMPQ
jgi:Family of unknown function (DUF5946)